MEFIRSYLRGGSMLTLKERARRSSAQVGWGAWGPLLSWAICNCAASCCLVDAVAARAKDAVLGVSPSPQP
jgi:hypothetical protein